MPKPTDEQIQAAVIGAVIGAIVMIVIGLPTLRSMWRSEITAEEALKVQQQQLTLEKENAERERDQAKSEAQEYRRMIEDAPTTFTKTLQTLIDSASAESEKREGPSNLLAAATALVSARMGLVKDLETIGTRLDTDIDELAQELSKPTPDPKKVSFLIDVLKRKWPAKMTEIKVAVRKIETELGFVPSLQEGG